MNDNDNIDEIRRDIENTRQRISTEIEALEGKLTPAHAKEVMAANVKERIVETKDRFVGRASHSAHLVRDNASRLGTDFVSTARANPMPLALIGAGAGWLVWEMMRPRRDVEIEVEPLFDLEGDTALPGGTFEEYQGFEEVGAIGDDVSVSSSSYLGSPSYTSGVGVERPSARTKVADKAAEVKQRARSAFEDARYKAKNLAGHTKERYSDVASTTRERASHLAVRGKEGIHRSKDVTSEAYFSNPIAFGALALAAGVGLAMALPHTRREDELLGRAHGKVAGRARELVDSAKSVAKDAVREGAHVAKDAAKQAYDDGRLTSR